MTGRPPSVTAKEVVEAVALHPEPIVTARDINDDLGLQADSARERMKTLVEEGYLESKKVGSSALVFWLTDQGRALLADPDSE